MLDHLTCGTYLKFIKSCCHAMLITSRHIALNPLQMVGCCFHYSQIMMRRLDKHGLRKLYRSDPEFKRWYRQLTAIAFLPACDIQDYWNRRYFEMDRRLRERLTPDVVAAVDAVLTSFYVSKLTIKFC